MDIDYKQGFALYLILLASLSVHEWAHAVVADKLGDHTPRLQGRVTFNPIAHIDPLGTVFIPLFMILFSPGFAIIGWGKPVMVNPLNFPNRVRDDILVSMAGPASNIVICLLMVVIGGVLLKYVPAIGGLLGQVILLNCVLIIFNMIPIPPLDGGRVAVGLLPKYFSYQLAKLERYGLFIIIGALFILPLIGKELGISLEPIHWYIQNISNFLITIISFLTGL